MAGYLILALLLVGFWGVLALRHLVRKIIALNIASSAIILLFLQRGAERGVSAPILVEGVRDIVDPVPQALMLTAIVVGVCLTALGLVLAYRIQRKYGTMDIREAERRAGEAHD
jgi:multicomponent Na+:H+ antiporter subunit C